MRSRISKQCGTHARTQVEAKATATQGRVIYILLLVGGKKEKKMYKSTVLTFRLLKARISILGTMWILLLVGCR